MLNDKEHKNSSKMSTIRAVSVDGISRLRVNRRGLAVGVGSLLPSESGDDIDESPVVLDSSSCSAGLLLFLLLLLHFGCLSLDFAGTSQGTVDFTTEETAGHLDGGQLAETTSRQRFFLDERGSVQIEDLVFYFVDSFQLANMISQRLDGFKPGDVDGVNTQVSAHEKLHLYLFFSSLPKGNFKQIETTQL